MQSVPLSPHGFVLLAAERTVTVTREEHHQDVLAGRTGRAVAELRPGRITAGKHAGQAGLEVALDGRRVGELTRLMAQRYRPMVDEIRARGYRAGCEALLREDARGVHVELRLPAATQHRAPEPPAVAAPAGATRWPGQDPSPPTAVLPQAVPQQRRPAPSAIPDPTAPASPAPGSRRARRLFGVTAAVVGVLVLASALGNGTQDDVPTGGTSALPSPVAAPAPPVEVDPVTTTSATPVAQSADGVADEPVMRATTAARSRSSTPTTTRPAPRTVEPAPEPEPEPEAESEPSGCDPNYDGCVPIARDVDCAGGSGDGPAYVEGPVRVVGRDIYGLDRGGEPGIGCE